MQGKETGRRVRVAVCAALAILLMALPLPSIPSVLSTATIRAKDRPCKGDAVHAAPPSGESILPPPPPHVTAQDAAYIALLTSLMDEEAPMRISRQTYAMSGVYPVCYSRTERRWVRPLGSPYDALEPQALASLQANKSRDYAILVPGDSSTYIYDDEASYSRGYQEAWKAHTWAKVGIDCNRHIEIMANGALPVFRDFQAVPATTMFAYPRPLMAHMLASAGETDVRRLALLRHYMLDWGMRHLTARAMVQYMAKITAWDDRGRVLFVDYALANEGDYLSAEVVTGMVDWLGHDRVDLLAVPHYLYEGGPMVGNSGGKLWGKGFGVVHSLPARPVDEPPHDPDQMLARLEAGLYSIVIWGCWTRSSHHFDVASRVYAGKPERLWLCDCEDHYNGWAHKDGGRLAKLGSVFIRELQLDKWPLLPQEQGKDGN